MSPPVHFSPRRIGHLNLFVSDVERSAAFYREVCGFKEIFREPDISMIFMTNGNTHHDLGLMEVIPLDHPGMGSSARGKTPGLNHLGFEMATEAELVAALDRAKQYDVPVLRTTDHQISHSVYMTELNGHLMEFYADVIDDWDAFYAANVGQLISSPWNPYAVAPDTVPHHPNPESFFKDPDSALAARNVAYAGLPVRDLLASVDYYNGVCGLRTVFIDEKAGFAVLEGTARGGCDVCLFRIDQFPATRILFGGIQLHDGKKLEDSLASLHRLGVAVCRLGEGDTSALVVLDPDGIPLIYSTADASAVMRAHGAEVPAAIAQLNAAAGRA